MSNSKRMFITAYCWMYGSTKKEAANVYRQKMESGSVGFIEAVIECFKENARKSFYDD